NVNKLESFARLASNVANQSGAIVSLAVNSSISESAEAVFTAIHNTTPRVPVLFASLLNLDEARAALERISNNSGVPATILGINAASENSPALGKQSTFLYISHDDLSSPQLSTLAAKIIPQHFR
ncbi:MAG: hypothetical protein R8K20_01845, partial [Gallionellaceae bacterium]